MEHFSQQHLKAVPTEPEHLVRKVDLDKKQEILPTTGTATDTYTVNVSGNAATATKLATPRTITINPAATAAASFDGSANVSPGVSVTTAAGTAASTLPATSATNLQAWLVTCRNCLAWLTARFDASGNANSATKLATARSVTVTPTATAAGSFDGSASITPGVSVTIANNAATNTLPTTSAQALSTWLDSARKNLRWLTERFDVRTANVTFYVNAETGSNSNTGTSSSTPLLNWTGVLDKLSRLNTTANVSVTFAAGVYDISSFVLPHRGVNGGTLSINGASRTTTTITCPELCYLFGVTFNNVELQSLGRFYITGGGVTFNHVNFYREIGVRCNAFVVLNNCEITRRGASYGSLTVEECGTIRIQSTLKLVWDGNPFSVIDVNTGGRIFASNATIAFNPTNNTSLSTAAFTLGGSSNSGSYNTGTGELIIDNTLTLTGSFGGRRYIIRNGSRIVGMTQTAFDALFTTGLGTTAGTVDNTNIIQ